MSLQKRSLEGDEALPGLSYVGVPDCWGKHSGRFARKGEPVASVLKRWCEQVGFRRCEIMHLAGPCSAGIAYK
jgi:hypothetical protein